MIEGVKIKKLKVIPDERGRVMEIFRCDDEFFQKFGQTYMTTNYPGVVKAWHYHKIQSDNVCCVSGMIKLVMYDPREDSPTKGEITELFIGEHNPSLVHIPANIYHGWKGIDSKESLVISIPTEAYNYKTPDEYRVDPYGKTVPYDWTRKDG
jgi:dTDP-4-dehydrorhamnose 3,5-epimerase